MGIVSAIFLLILILYLTYASAVKKPADQNAKDFISFEVYEGMGVEDIAMSLKEEGMISSDFYFKAYVWINGKKADFKAGEFGLSKSMNIEDIVYILTDNISGEIQFTVQEGKNISEIADIIVEKQGQTPNGKEYSPESKKLIRENFIEASKEKYSYEFLKDKPANADLEGYLFPDTYRVYRNSTSEEIIEKMLEDFNAKVYEKVKNKLANQSLDFHEVIILASIVQNEAVTEEDMRIIAGIFLKRFRSNMRLRSCATINYITGKKEFRVTREDIGIDSPYNTYIYDGLPAGPIGNPGLVAIEAVLNPKETDYWFFQADHEHNIVYSVTGEEHEETKEEIKNE